VATNPGIDNEQDDKGGKGELSPSGALRAALPLLLLFAGVRWSTNFLLFGDPVDDPPFFGSTFLPVACRGIGPVRGSRLCGVKGRPLSAFAGGASFRRFAAGGAFWAMHAFWAGFFRGLLFNNSIRAGLNEVPSISILPPSSTTATAAAKKSKFVELINFPPDRGHSNSDASVRFILE